RAGRRRRRLPDEALRARGAARAPARAPAPHGRRLWRDPAVRRSRARSGHARGQARRRADRADANGVLAARALHAEPAVGADEVGDLRARLGLRLRLRLELARRLHRLPAAQDGGRRQAEADPHGAWRRLRASRTFMSFRTRLALVAAVAVALAVVIASVVVSVVVRNQLRG